MSTYNDDDRYGEGYADAMRARLRAGDDAVPLTIEDVRNMTQEEINRHWDEIVPILEAHR